MAYTDSELVRFGGGGGEDPGRPEFWLEDILFLLQRENPDSIVKRNIIFQNAELKGVMASDVKEGDVGRIVILTCPPYFVPKVRKP